MSPCRQVCMLRPTMVKTAGAVVVASRLGQAGLHTTTPSSTSKHPCSITTQTINNTHTSCHRSKCITMVGLAAE